MVTPSPGTIQFQEKVRKLLSRYKKKPVLKPNKPLVLQDRVSSRSVDKGDATCLTEMSVMMACWKENNFVDTFCSREIDTFYTCVNKVLEARKNKSEQGSTTKGRLTPKQATTLLKRFPNPVTEV
ncbi:small ribosomal subunit protein mS37 [Austrofundulus limnaeus]|uniref:Small ribosomal subunit protein mS37 n=1 Tax=Austrofundulus limnaeus TaxID=52670 RepID=A0A2I4AXB3_AUSLI|nr:PREDICTED: coiled-coil-helix-coiled-coil-helix domain-containing protein 1 [Austrofundulus limnaeus]